MKVVIPGWREVSLQLTTLQLSLLVLFLIPIVLAILYQLMTLLTSTGRKRILAILGFLIAFSLVLTISFFIFALYQPYDLWLAIYGDIYWGLIGISPFFLVYYTIILAFPEFFSEHKWTIILPVIGLIGYEIIVLPDFSALLENTTLLVYSLIYLLIIPLFTTYHYLRLDRIRGTPRVKWIVAITLGVVLWFLGFASSSVLGIIYPTSWIAPGTEIVLAILALAWWIILLGSIMDSRVGRQGSV